MLEIKDYGENSRGFGGESSSINKRRLIDALQTSLLPYFRSHLFPWVCLILFLNRRDWKRPVIII